MSAPSSASPTPSRSQAWWRRALRWCAGAGAAFALLVASVIHFEPELRGYVRLVLERELAALLAGQVHLDRVEHVDLGGIVAQGVTVIDPNGAVVLRAQRIELDLNAYELFRARLHFTRGRLVAPRIRAIPSDQAAITLFDALIPKAPPSKTPSPLDIYFDGIHIEQGTLYGSVPGLDRIEASAIEARGQIRLERAFVAEVTSVKARVGAPFELPVNVEEAGLEIATEPLRIDGVARVSLTEDHARVALEYKAPENAPDHLSLTVVVDPASSELLRALDVSIGESVITKLQGAIRLSGPLDHLSFNAALRSDAGPIVIRGELPKAAAMTLQVQTEELELARLLAYFPPVKIRATVRASVPPQGPIAIEARSPWVDVLGVVIEQTDLAGTYEKGRFDISRLRASYSGGRFRASGWVDENADGRIHLLSQVPNLGKTPSLQRSGVQVGLETDAVLEKHGEALSFKGSLGLQQFRYRDLTFDAVQVKGDVHTDSDLTKPEVHLHGNAAGLIFKGYAVQGVDLVLRGKHGRYGADFSFADAAKRVLTGHVDVEQRGETFHVVANPFELAVAQREPWRAQADLTVDPDGIDFHKLLLANGPQRLELSGRYSYSKAYRVDATLQRFDLGGLRELSGLDLADLDGTVDGTLALTGVPKHPRIDAQGSLRDGVFLGMTNLTVLLSLAFVEGRFDVDAEIVLPDQSRLSLYAGGEPGKGDTWTAQILSGNYQFGMDFERIPFSVSKPWLAWIGVKPPPGTISATLRGAGTWLNPTLDVKSRVDKIELPGLPPLDIDFSAAHDGRVLKLRELQVSDPHGTIFRSEGSLSATTTELADPSALRASLGSRQFRVTADWPLRRLDELPERVRIALPIATSGGVLLEQTPLGPAAKLEVQAKWPEGEQGIGACTVIREPEVTFRATALPSGTNGKLEIHVEREQLASGTVTAAIPLVDWLTGTTEFELPKTAVTFEASTENAEEIPVLCEHMAGPLRVALNSSDLFADPPEARFVVESAAIQLVPHPSQTQRLGNLRSAIATGRPFAFAVRGGVEGNDVTFAGALDQGNGARLEANGHIPRAALRRHDRPANLPPGQAAVRFVNFELAPILLAFPVGARVSGVLNGSTRVAYDVNRDVITLDGFARMSRGRVVISPLGQELSQVTAGLRMQGNWIRIEDLEARDFSGLLRAEGNVIFETLHHVRSDLALRLSDFPIRREGAKVSSLTGRLAVRTEVDPERARTEIEVVDLRVNLPNDLGQSVQDLDTHPDIEVVGEHPEAAPEHPYLFEVHFLAQNPPFRVMRTGLNAEVRADLTVRYRDPRLSILGNAELRHGNFEMYGKRFELQQSQMAFDGSDELDPLVNLYAVYKAENSTEIGVRVEGRLSDPKVSFTSSDPTLTDTGQIIAELLGARSTDESLQQRQDATGAAAGFLAGATAGLLTEEVRKEFGGAIPVLSIESRSQSMKTTRIRAGVQLDQLIEKRLGPLRHVVRGAYVEGFVAPGADPNAVNTSTPPQSRGGGLLELRFPRDLVGTVEYRPVQNWRLDVAWEP